MGHKRDEEELPPERDVYHEYKDNSNDPELARLQKDAYAYAARMLTMPLIDLDFCGHCHEHAGFEQDEEKEWVSECCGVRAVSID